jgi:hypothetical protein
MSSLRGPPRAGPVGPSSMAGWVQPERIGIRLRLEGEDASWARSR